MAPDEKCAAKGLNYAPYSIAAMEVGIYFNKRIEEMKERER